LRRFCCRLAKCRPAHASNLAKSYLGVRRKYLQEDKVLFMCELSMSREAPSIVSF
jgi:hypothetical protein